MKSTLQNSTHNQMKASIISLPAPLLFGRKVKSSSIRPKHTKSFCRSVMNSAIPDAFDNSVGQHKSKKLEANSLLLPIYEPTPKSIKSVMSPESMPRAMGQRLKFLSRLKPYTEAFALLKTAQIMLLLLHMLYILPF